jgi:hypothetical protein
MLVVAILILAASSLLAWAWVRGIDNMKDNHLDYKGEDLFGEFDEWDNSHHNEDV